MATSKLQREAKRELQKHFGKYDVIENSRPSWLITQKGQRLELDLFIPELEIAIEIQGKQHYIFTPYFHKNMAHFISQQKRDASKRALCESRGIALYDVSSSHELTQAIVDIRKKCGELRGSWHPLDRCLKRRESVKLRYLRMIAREMNNLNRQDRKLDLLERMNKKLFKYGGERMTMFDAIQVIKAVGIL